MIKVSDYVIDYIANQGVEYVFMVSGGGGMHLIDSLGNRKDVKYICNHHEQASVMSAEGYQRITGNIGVALVTTGPAGTNALTGILCAWNDSIPLIVISGQANSKSLIGDTGLRQRGVHEADITTLVKSVTKYAITVRDENMIQYHIEKAIYLAKSGRPGPVWIDIPIDIQSKMIDLNNIPSFNHDKVSDINSAYTDQIDKLDIVRSWLGESKRPIILAGHGIRLSGSEERFLHFIEKYRIPVVTTKNGLDLVYDNHELLAGRVGINGQRAGNFAVQNADLVICLGSRLSFPTVGYATEHFAREAKKIVIDVDNNQLKHSTIKVDLPINIDVDMFIRDLDSALEDSLSLNFEEWINKCKLWRNKYQPVLENWKTQKEYVNSYYFFEVLSEEMSSYDSLVVDQGATFYSSTVAFRVKKGQRVFTNGGFSPMGYGLPAAIGACYGQKQGKVVCVHGDGGLQMNIQELQTIVHNQLPIKLFVFDNEGYLSIKHTQTNFFNGHFVGCDPDSGVSCPSTNKIAEAYGIKSLTITQHSEAREKIKEALEYDGAIIVNVLIHPMQEYSPKVSSVRNKEGIMISKPLEDMSPLLDREEFKNEMIVKIIEE